MIRMRIVSEGSAFDKANLACCVVYATLMGISPQGLSEQADTVGAEDAGYLARVAWDTVEKYQ